jgi:Tfp pilus assembly major pilin PilA
VQLGLRTILADIAPEFKSVVVKNLVLTAASYISMMNNSCVFLTLCQNQTSISFSPTYQGGGKRKK